MQMQVRKQTFTLLMKSLREHLATASEQDGKYYQLSAAVSAGFVNIENTEPALYSQYLDFVNIMTYDMHGAWDNCNKPSKCSSIKISTSTR